MKNNDDLELGFDIALTVSGSSEEATLGSDYVIKLDCIFGEGVK